MRIKIYLGKLIANVRYVHSVVCDDTDKEIA